MSNKQFISNLSSTYADVRKLDVKKINLKGKNILEYIKENVPTIKHSQDTRETVTENDLWGQWIETTSDGTIIIHDDWVTNPNASSSNAWNDSITKVEDNKAYVGDTLYANIQLEKIKNGDNMFYRCENLTSFSSDLPNLTYCDYMFGRCSNLTSFNSDLSSLTYGSGMFYGCTNLTSFSSDLSSLTNGVSMFYQCTNLTSFSSDLPNLTNGVSMFSYCTNLTSFSSDLPNLTEGEYMFYGCSNLKSFSSDLSSLTFGNCMFTYCTNLKSFSSDLSSLTYGGSMFGRCSNLTSFSSDLSSLTYGGSMFNSCKIDAESVMYIADTIKDITAEKQLYSDGTIPGTIPYVTLSNGVYSAPRGFMSDGEYVYTYNNPKPYTRTIGASDVGKLTLGINVSNNADTIQQQLEDFAQEATFETWADLKTHFSKKGWNVTWQYGGNNTSITYDMRGNRAIPCPVYTQLIEISPEGVERDEEGNETGNMIYTDKQKNRAKYTNEDGSKFYNINWGHDVTNYDDFQQFDSLEDAAVAYGVFLKENIITTEE